MSLLVNILILVFGVLGMLLVIWLVFMATRRRNE